MPDISALWKSGARKEALDLLSELWQQLDTPGRDALAAQIVAGPPAQLIERIEPDNRQRSRDRRIFDRLVVVERVGDPPLTEALLQERQRLRAMYPDWNALPGEQAHFSSWLETHTGLDARYDVTDLKALTHEQLLAVMYDEQETREGLLENLRQFAIDNPNRVLGFLETLLRSADVGPTDMWRHGLWGLRDHAKSPEFRNRLLALLVSIPDALVGQPEIASAAADILDAASRDVVTEETGTQYWTAFDRVMPIIAADPENADVPERNKWVSLAINRSLGRLAGAFFNAMFGRGLKVGEGIPRDLVDRLNRLVVPGERSKRLARVIAASRLSYLFAVDSEWTRQTLLPGFNWTDEEESLALWQGYAWQARIDAQLWAALKPSFLPLFTTARLESLGSFGRNIAQLLMLVGIEFGANELPRDEARNAIRTMPEELRSSAAAWIASYLQQQTLDVQEPGVTNVDTVWQGRVAPWLQRVWPTDPASRSVAISEQFGLAAIATDLMFDDAITTIAPYVVRTNGFRLLHQLGQSAHPETHPEGVIRLIELLIEPHGFRFGRMGVILDRLVAARPGIAEDPVFRRWRELIRLREG